jgi:hypothetical protein
MAVDFNMKKVLPGLGRLVPGLSQQKLHTRIRLNIATSVVSKGYGDFPLERSLGVQVGKFDCGMGLGKQFCGNQHVTDSNGVL